MAAACRWGVESGNLIYPRTFGHVPTCVSMLQTKRALRFLAAEEEARVFGILSEERSGTRIWSIR
jgi:hypothetical protein